ncbi:MAG TPA: DedA family protein [Streptosporangiaceae bacterium]|nr:DedA family protein [Streptosporangiaceae bacterium]
MQSFLTHTELLALILFGIVEACCVPISSEITFGFAGVLAAQQGHLSLPVVIIVGTLAELIGSFISYAVGRKGGRPAVERYGRYVLITSRDLDRVERFFAGKGAWAVLIVRLLPVLRAFGGLVSGIVEVPVAQFAIFNAIGTLIFATALSGIGYGVGSAWTRVSKDLSIGGYVIVVLVVLAVAAVIVLRLREFRRERAAGTLPAALQEPAALQKPAAVGEPTEPAPPVPPTSHRRTARRR